MKRVNREIAKKIEELAKSSEQTENQILNEIIDFFRSKNYKKAIKDYVKGKKNVTEICKNLNISTKKFYRLLKENGVKLKLTRKEKQPQNHLNIE